MNAPRSSIQHVSDTARWVALYRAMESERPDAIFKDPYARKLAGEHGERIVGSLPKGRRMAWPIIVRTAVMDEQIMDAVERNGVDTVLNLAAGLDTRPFRLPLPRGLRWIEVDFPDVIAYKQKYLADERARSRLGHVGLDLTDVAKRQAFFASVGEASKNVLVISEGLLIYLTPSQVAEFARDLAAPPAFRSWLIDLASPRLIKMLEKTWGKAVAAGGAPFQFAPAEGTAFFEPHGWKEAEFRSIWEEANRLNRADVPLRWLWNFLSRFSSEKKREETRRMSGTVMLKRT